MFETIIFLSLVSAPLDCQIKIQESGNFLSDGKAELLLPLVDKAMKVRTCFTWKDFPNLLVTEVDYQEDDGDFRDLFVYQPKSGKKLFQYTIYKNYSFQEKESGKTKHVNESLTPLFEKSSKGKPQIRFKESSAVFTLDL